VGYLPYILAGAGGGVGDFVPRKNEAIFGGAGEFGDSAERTRDGADLGCLTKRSQFPVDPVARRVTFGRYFQAATFVPLDARDLSIRLEHTDPEDLHQCGRKHLKKRRIIILSGRD
jgi:hypothetical protein